MNLSFSTNRWSGYTFGDFIDIAKEDLLSEECKIWV